MANGPSGGEATGIYGPGRRPMGHILDSLADRHRGYESRFTSATLMPGIPTLARLDGKAFTRLTRPLALPFDGEFRSVMGAVTARLVEESEALVGYTQSDEISLAWLVPSHRPGSAYLGGNVVKTVGVLASIATGWFNRLAAERLPAIRERLPAAFDCRVWQVPDRATAVDYFRWREADAVNNSLNMAVRAHGLSDRTFKLSFAEKNETLFRAGVNWNDYPAAFRRGVYARRTSRTAVRRYSPEELEALPPAHHARKTGEVWTTRKVVEVGAQDPIHKMADAAGFLFGGAGDSTGGGDG